MSNDPSFTLIEQDCLDCNGTGKDEEDMRCKTCYGKGYLTVERQWRQFTARYTKADDDYGD